jgi:hypothetical protein
VESLQQNGTHKFQTDGWLIFDIESYIYITEINLFKDKKIQWDYD